VPVGLSFRALDEWSQGFQNAATTGARGTFLLACWVQRYRVSCQPLREAPNAQVPVAEAYPVSPDGRAQSCRGGRLDLIGDVTIDSANQAIEGDNINVMAVVGDRGLIQKGFGTLVPTSLTIVAGIGTVTVSNISEFASLLRPEVFTVSSAGDVELGNVFMDGNTATFTSAGDILVTGALDDAGGDITLASSAGSVTLQQAVSAAGSVDVAGTAVTSADTIQAAQDLTLTGSLSISVNGAVTTSVGDVTLNSAGSLIVNDTISAAANASLVGNTIATTQAIEAGANVTVAAAQSVVLNGTVASAGGDVVVSTSLASSGSDAVGVSITKAVTSTESIIVASEGDVTIRDETLTPDSLIVTANDVEVTSVNGGVLLDTIDVTGTRTVQDPTTGIDEIRAVFVSGGEDVAVSGAITGGLQGGISPTSTARP
jgi:hypothetical protein